MSDPSNIEAIQEIRASVRARLDGGDLASAEQQLHAALARTPRNAALIFDLAEVLLRGRRYAEGWRYYEARRFLLPKRSIPPVAGAEWDGSDPRGARIAVCGEQGLGDQIMFGRYLDELRGRGAEVTVALPLANLSELFDQAGFSVTGLTANQTPSGADFWCYFGSLPLKLGLAAPPAAQFIHLPSTSGGGIGVCATGSPIQWNDRQRSLPPDLQHRLGRLGRDLRPQATGEISMLATAKIIAELDLVISVDTAVAHLALSMGKPTWVLLAVRGRDYRWNDGVHSDWYPQARIFRQATPGDWSAVLDEVEAALRAADSPVAMSR